MGFYINPENESKEDFLRREGKSMGPAIGNSFEWENLPDGSLPVIIIDNGYFTAAGIAFSEREFEELAAAMRRLDDKRSS